MSSFVKTPSGVVMHVDNHKKAVDVARSRGLNGLLLMLEPTTEVEVIDVPAAQSESPYRTPGKVAAYDDFFDFMNEFLLKVVEQTGKQPIKEIVVEREFAICRLGCYLGDGVFSDTVDVHTPVGVVRIRIEPPKKR